MKRIKLRAQAAELRLRLSMVDRQLAVAAKRLGFPCDRLIRAMRVLAGMEEQ